MENAGILQLVAELSVGVLGFSGVVAALGRRRAGDWAPIDRVRFFSMVRISALVLALAILPFPFHSAGLSSQTIWGWCSGLGTFLLLFSLATRRFWEATPERVFTDPGTSRAAFAFVTFAYLGALLLLGLNVVGLGFHRSATPYLVAVLLTFGVPVLLFIRLLHTAIVSERAA